MNELGEKLVDFEKWCPKCKYCDLPDFKDPCAECLDEPVNVHSEKPVNYKNKEDDK